MSVSRTTDHPHTDRAIKRDKNIGKLRSRWDGPFVITNVFPHGAVQLKDEHSNSTFQVNGHQIKPFHEGPAPITHDMEIISLMEPASPDDPASH
ncbi:hypothetical protein CR513_54869, partial [Mucuna pruriens]